MGYKHIYGHDIENRNFYSPLYEEVLEKISKMKEKNLVVEILRKKMQ